MSTLHTKTQIKEIKYGVKMNIPFALNNSKLKENK